MGGLQGAARRNGGLAMRFWAIMGLILCMGAAPLRAAEVQTTFTLPEGYGDMAVSWSATPLDLPEGADVLGAMIMEPEAAAGPWVLPLPAGEYLISAFSEVEVFELTLSLGADPAVQAFEVPLLSLEASAVFHCDGQASCPFADPVTGLVFDLPQGWSAEQPYYADLGGGQRATEVSGVFYQDVSGEGGAVWFLNPVDWIEDDAGPCREVGPGLMCTFDLAGDAEQGFGMLAPSLKLAPAAAP